MRACGRYASAPCIAPKCRRTQQHLRNIRRYGRGLCARHNTWEQFLCTETPNADGRVKARAFGRDVFRDVAKQQASNKTTKTKMNLTGKLQQQKFRPTQPGGRATFFSFLLLYIYFIKFNSFIQFLQIQFKFNSNSIQIRTSFLNDARELVAREVRQTCAARSGRTRSGPVSRPISLS